MSTFDDDTTGQLSNSHDNPTEQLSTLGDDVEDQRPVSDSPEPRSLSRPTGPSWSTIALGLVCVVVAGGALLVELTELSVRWDRSGPLALVGLGILLVLVGLAALMRRSDDDEDEGQHP